MALRRRLGKQAHKFDERTLMLAKFVLPEIRVPQVYDFDKNKTPLAVPVWGNDVWNNSVIAGEANQLLRLERIGQRRTVKLTTPLAVERYKKLTGAVKPNDAKDNGLAVLNAMDDWLKNGFKIGHRNYKIAAYGELEPDDKAQLRSACYVLHGIHLGFWLPKAAEKMPLVWDFSGEKGPEWKPGSWGGHLAYSKKFTPEGFEILTWGKKVFVANNFIDQFCDEAWAVIDSFDSWHVKQTINVKELTAQLQQVKKGASA